MSVYNLKANKTVYIYLCKHHSGYICASTILGLPFVGCIVESWQNLILAHFMAQKVPTAFVVMVTCQTYMRRLIAMQQNLPYHDQ